MRDIVFLHPDLGIGGAERAVIDMALALKSRGHRVHMVTAHHDRSHCFEETRDGRLNVTCVGDWLPRSLFGRCRALCAYLRMIYAALYLVFFSGLSYDVVICDQISACIPFLRCRCRSSAKILFYCHFPDLLLTGRKSLFKRLYRAPIDWLEEVTTGMADCVLVNSRFTAEIFKNTFRSLNDVKPDVLYPVPDCFNSSQSADKSDLGDILPSSSKVVFLSINRYERKKNLGLALEALSLMRGKLSSSASKFKEVHLVIAGGYDDLVDENREYHKELVALTSKLDLENNVTFLRNVTASQKHSLMTLATCLLYTPDNEHFGIVPVEAMYCRCPVIAVNSGGPRETVVSGQTGFLCDNTPADFADAMVRFTGTGGVELKKKFGEAGHRRVRECFSFEAFTEKLDAVVCAL